MTTLYMANVVVFSSLRTFSSIHPHLACSTNLHIITRIGLLGRTWHANVYSAGYLCWRSWRVSGSTTPGDRDAASRRGMEKKNLLGVPEKLGLQERAGRSVGYRWFLAWPKKQR